MSHQRANKNRANSRSPPPPSSASASGTGGGDTYTLNAEALAKYGLTAVTNPRVRTKAVVAQLGLAAFHIVERHVPGVDDPVYERNRDVWEQVPRGWACVYSESAGGGLTRVATLAGARKFGYSNSPYGSRSDVVTCVGIEKENGECGHLAAFVHLGTPYWIAGSKHVHIVFRANASANADIASYGDGVRYNVARKIAALWLAQAKSMDPKAVTALHAELAERRVTACFEAIFADSQHIVDYHGQQTMRFFALSRDAPSAEGLVLDWADAKDFFARYALPSAEISAEMAIGSEEYAAFLQSVARRINSEGVVMYGRSATGQCCCMWKEKSYPYVMERCTREAIKRGLVRDALRDLLRRRLDQQDAAVRDYFRGWEATRMPWLVDFASWLHFTRRWTTDEWALSTRWLTLQAEFAAAPEDEKEKARTAKLEAAGGGVKRLSEVVICVGPPGSGKSTLSRTIYGLLQQCGLGPRWLNQDESGSRQRYLTNVQSAADDPSTTHLILDKVNVAVGNRADYQRLGLEPTLTVLFQHPDGIDAFRQTCVDRVVARGTMHRTLRVADGERAEAEKVFDDIMSQYDAPDDGTVIPVDVSAPFEETLRLVWKALTERTSFSNLPELETLDAVGALQKARAYEALLAKYGDVDHQYAAVVIRSPLDDILALVPPKALADKELRPAFHITLKFFGGVMDPIWFAEVAAVVGQPVEVDVLEVVYDDNGVAIVVSGPFRCANKTPHITIACAKGVRPVYSNELIHKADGVTRISIAGAKLAGEYALM